MNKLVFLNSGRIDFDKSLDFSALSRLTDVTKYDNSTDEEILDRIKEQNIVVSKELLIGKELIERFPSSVKLICEAGTGYNNIDIEAARDKGISVCNVPGYSTEAVAQLVITFILSLSSSLSAQQRMLERKDYSNFTSSLRVPHFEIQNKTLGVVGAGHIGLQVIKVAKTLGMNILVHSRTAKDLDDSSIKFVGIDELLEKSDFVTLHCPLTEKTRNLIDMNKLEIMKPSAFIINTSRGAIIKEKDLIRALNRRIIAGAALDVQDPEPPEESNPLFTMDNVIITPHIGWKCIEARQRLLNVIAENVEAFIQEKPINIIR